MKNFKETKQVITLMVCMAFTLAISGVPHFILLNLETNHYFDIGLIQIAHTAFIFECVEILFIVKLTVQVVN